MVSYVRSLKLSPGRSAEGEGPNRELDISGEPCGPPAWCTKG
jgi:hypothetical protein